MRRRDFIALASAAAAFPRVAFAQQVAKVPRVALVSASFSPASLTVGGDPAWAAFIIELARLGFVEGRTISFDRYTVPVANLAEGSRTILAAAPDLIFLNGATSAAATLKGLTQAIPIVTTSGDPIGQGLVSNLTRPGGNVSVIASTGNGPDSEAKNLAFLAEAAPHARRVAYLQTGVGTQFSFTQQGYVDSVRNAAAKLGLSFLPIIVQSPTTEVEITRAFDAARQGGPDMIQYGFTTVFGVYPSLIANLALDARMPSFAPFQSFTEAGGLMSYNSNAPDLMRKAANYVALILGGTKPGDLPVQQPTVFDFVFNLATAKAIGVTIPATLLVLATQVIS